MGFIFQILVNGLIAGAIYSLVAVGFSLIYSTTKMIHFAHGSVIALSAYAFYFLFSVAHINIFLAIILTIILAAVIGYLINLVFYKTLRTRKASPSILLISSIAILVMLESVILLLFGPNVKTIDLFAVEKGVNFAGSSITPLEVFIIAASIVLFLLISVFMNKTKLGKALRAVADNKDVAEIVGISSERIYAYTFIIGSAIAGIASILIGLEQNLSPTMGTNLILKGLTAAIIGGIGSVPGAFLGAILLGVGENVGIVFLPSGFKDAIAFIILFAFLLFRPNGFLGKRRR